MTEICDSQLTTEQQDTAKLLDRLLGRALSERYVVFCLLASGAFELRVSRPVAAHALRELESMLRDALVVPMEVEPGDVAVDPVWFSRARAALEEFGFEGAPIERALIALKPRVMSASDFRHGTIRNRPTRRRKPDRGPAPRPERPSAELPDTEAAIRRRTPRGRRRPGPG